MIDMIHARKDFFSRIMLHPAYPLLAFYISRENGNYDIFPTLGVGYVATIYQSTRVRPGSASLHSPICIFGAHRPWLPSGSSSPPPQPPRQLRIVSPTLAETEVCWKRECSLITRARRACWEREGEVVRVASSSPRAPPPDRTAASVEAGLTKTQRRSPLPRHPRAWTRWRSCSAVWTRWMTKPTLTRRRSH